MEKLNCILLIDDDVATNFLNKRLLLKMDVVDHVSIAKNGKEGLEYIKNAFDEENENYPRPDIVFLDLNMPLVNGWEFLEAYKELPEAYRQSVIVVMLTTSLRPVDKERADITSEVYEYYQKPLTTENVNKLIQDYHTQKMQEK